ncbi:MAG TPA: double-strand break repair helicase AddA [Pseudolabrys sp.]|nr:double-strand break repair helicase AddA [Pseudolabrys sp.]
MTTPRRIPDDVRDVQIRAADPDVSAFVSANAGSGKTYVLAQRVINLLLRGVDPAKILCITFTKTAAANMANEVFKRLAGWTALGDAALDQEIALSTGAKPDAAQRARARRLFASALETPGGLKVQTIHAFCTRLLHQFPFEANVAARFTVLDEASTTQLLDQLSLQVLLEASAKPDGALGQALATAIVVAADQTFKDVVGDAIRKRDAIDAWTRRAGSVDRAMAELSKAFGLDPKDTPESVEQEYFSHSLIPAAEWPALIEILDSGSASDKKHIATLEAARAAAGRERIDNYLRVFCTTELEPRKYIVTKKIADKHPDWLARLQSEQARVCKLIERERALAARERTRALVTIAAEVIARYAREKERRALLDYDDLIDKTISLFTRASAAWVLYTLDLGIDHVLIDEAQDTSPKQWSIVRTIVSEFTPGGARANTRRTVFAVGDEKQSIFSFQGAAPRAFDEMRREFDKQFNTPEMGWRYLSFHHSFRSGENVLGGVDRVFAAQDIFVSVTTDTGGVPPHISLPDAAPGLVELWPLIAPPERHEIEGWDAPFDTESEISPRVVLARRIASHVKLWMARGQKAGDVLVLVRQRGPLFEAIIRALKNAEIPVAGADRLVLTEHIAVMDLMALADALLLPDDDLALASVLKSPLFGLSEEQLFELAWDRGTLSLRASLRTNAPFAETESALDELACAARKLSPFGFFAHVLGPLRGRAKFLARLGPEANDALDEFLNLALDYEARATPSLQGYLAWLRAAQSEVKRDMEMVRDEVRVMTVHGAKGLEAKTVILADTTTPPGGPRDPRLLTLDNGALVWATARGDDVDAMMDARALAKQDARDEYRRLLYVAMTRAKERLVIVGTQGSHKIPDGCWYQLVESALKPDCVAEPADDGGGDVLRYRKRTSQPEKIEKTASSVATKPTSVPAWLKANATSDSSALRTITPSSVEDVDDARPFTAAGNAKALLRGTLVHRLMQSLPDIPAGKRLKAAEDYLARAGSELAEEERARIAERVMLVLEDARFYELFAPGSHAEVPIVGRLILGGETVRVSGQIDRLVVTQTAVLIGDFKTNRPAPRRIEDVPQSYLRQLALYRAVLAKLYLDKPIRAALIFTEVPDLMELSGELLDAALLRITSAR